MELEFDKEMDAILRKARDSGAAATTAVDPPHPDADAIAAFAENALPAKARETYLRHFADCDSCRSALVRTISSKIDDVPAVSVARPVAEPPARRWYESLFDPAKLAVALGAIVLAFTGIIGYLAIQNRNAAERIDVAQIREPVPRATNPAPAANTASSSASSNASVALVGNTAASNSTAEAELPAAPSAARTSGPSATSSDVIAPAETKRSENKAVAETEDKAPKPAASAPPPPADQPAAGVNERRSEPAKQKDERDDAGETATAGGAVIHNDSLSTNSAPKRISGPRNMNQVQQQGVVIARDRTEESKARRRVAGKTFDRRDGAWYDSAYHGAATQNYRRGTDEYKQLDAGVRSIADALGGTVVIVWKGKALRVN